jgi:hypothetical protein
VISIYSVGCCYLRGEGEETHDPLMMMLFHFLGATDSLVKSEKFLFEGDVDETGEEIDEDGIEDGDEARDQHESTSSFPGQANIDGENDEEEANEIEDEKDKLELAWEVLDVARVIYSRREDDEGKEKLIQVHMILGDISLENGNS